MAIQRPRDLEKYAGQLAKLSGDTYARMLLETMIDVIDGAEKSIHANAENVPRHLLGYLSGDRAEPSQVVVDCPPTHWHQVGMSIRPGMTFSPCGEKYRSPDPLSGCEFVVAGDAAPIIPYVASDWTCETQSAEIRVDRVPLMGDTSDAVVSSVDTLRLFVSAPSSQQAEELFHELLRGDETTVVVSSDAGTSTECRAYPVVVGRHVTAEPTTLVGMSFLRHFLHAPSHYLFFEVTGVSSAMASWPRSVRIQFHFPTPRQLNRSAKFHLNAMPLMNVSMRTESVRVDRCSRTARITTTKPHQSIVCIHDVHGYSEDDSHERRYVKTGMGRFDNAGDSGQLTPLVYEVVLDRRPDERTEALIYVSDDGMRANECIAVALEQCDGVVPQRLTVGDLLQVRNGHWRPHVVHQATAVLPPIDITSVGQVAALGLFSRATFRSMTESVTDNLRRLMLSTCLDDRLEIKDRERIVQWIDRLQITRVEGPTERGITQIFAQVNPEVSHGYVLAFGLAELLRRSFWWTNKLIVDVKSNREHWRWKFSA